jgi:ABC-type transport system substrate-binding protein
MSRNEGYWDKVRIPKLAKMILIPMPEATTRLATLRAGQVDWIEVPPADAIESLKSAGFQISLWPYPDTWPYVLNTTGNSPFRDKRVRQAANFAIDRDGLVKLLNGTAEPASGTPKTIRSSVSQQTITCSTWANRRPCSRKPATAVPSRPRS